MRFWGVLRSPLTRPGCILERQQYASQRRTSSAAIPRQLHTPGAARLPASPPKPPSGPGHDVGPSRLSGQDIREAATAAERWQPAVYVPGAMSRTGRRALLQCDALARCALRCAVSLGIWFCAPVTRTPAKAPDPQPHPLAARRAAPRTSPRPRNPTPAARRPPPHRPCNARRSRSD